MQLPRETGQSMGQNSLPSCLYHGPRETDRCACKMQDRDHRAAFCSIYAEVTNWHSPTCPIPQVLQQLQQQHKAAPPELCLRPGVPAPSCSPPFTMWGKMPGLTSLRSSYSRRTVILKTHPAALLALDYNSSWQLNSLRHCKLSVTERVLSHTWLQKPPYNCQAEAILFGYLSLNNSKTKFR